MKADTKESNKLRETLLPATNMKQVYRDDSCSKTITCLTNNDTSKCGTVLQVNELDDGGDTLMHRLVIQSKSKQSYKNKCKSIGLSHLPVRQNKILKCFSIRPN